MMDSMPADILARLRARPAARAVLELLAAHGGVHLVGGAVRDALLGLEPRELDFVVEGDARPVAAAVARTHGVTPTAHERFGTARVVTDELALDFATARHESYPHPGALPVVELGASLADDLRRRDFTVNAAAVATAGRALTTVPHTMADLDARRLRVLHPGSFQDDPTRLLRLCRYAARLDFEIHVDTRALAEAAVAGQALSTVSRERIGRELRRLIAEPDAKALVPFAELGMGAAALHPDFALDRGLATRVAALCPAGAEAGLAVLATCLRAVTTEELRALLVGLGFDAHSRDLVLGVHARADRLARDLPGLVDALPSRRAERLRGERPETVAVAAVVSAEPAVLQLARQALDGQASAELLIDGNDLVAAGLSGRRVGEGLQAAAAAMLDGRAVGRDEQLAAALAARDPA